MSSASVHPTLIQTYGERSEEPGLTPLATYLLRLMHVKRTNLCLSADVSTSSELLQLAEDVGDQICMIKTHADIVKDFSDRTARRLADIAKRRQFVVFEDRKFGDIGNTVQEQYVGGPLSIVRWAHIVNAHIFPGPSIITALAEGAKKAIASHNTSVQTSISASPAVSLGDATEEGSVSSREFEGEADEHAEHEDDQHGYESPDIEEDADQERLGRKQSVVSVSTTISTKTEAISPQPALKPSLSRGASEASDVEEETTDLEELGPPPFYRSLLLLAQMSSKDNFLDSQYTLACVAHARANRDFVMGFIAQESLNSERSDNFITMTPGVQLSAGGDAMGQQYNTPQKVVAEGGSDIIIVGRGILRAPDRRRAAHEYRKQGWAAYESRLKAGRRRR